MSDAPSKTRPRRKSEPMPKVVAFDLETTGLDPARDSIIEIAGVEFTLGGETKGTFQQLVNPGRKIPREAVEKTRITDDMVRGAPSPSDAVGAFAEWVGPEAILLAHYASFDCSFLEACATHGARFPVDWQFVDTWQWAKSFGMPVRDFKLATLLKHLKYKRTDSHRALADSHGVAAVATHLANLRKNPRLALTRRAKTLHDMSHPPASSRQLSYLRSLGAKEAEFQGIDRERASTLIDAYKARQPRQERRSHTEPAESGCVWIVALCTSVPVGVGFVLWFV